MPRMSVLLLEGDAAERERIAGLLLRVRGVDFDTTARATLAEALDALATQTFDVVLSDLTLTDSDGEATFRRLKARAMETPIVALIDPHETALGLVAVE